AGHRRVRDDDGRPHVRDLGAARGFDLRAAAGGGVAHTGIAILIRRAVGRFGVPDAVPSICGAGDTCRVRAGACMTNYEKFLSRAGESMRESAIRKMGTVLAQARDVISFAPGYPAEDSFPWQAFSEIAQELLSGKDGSVLQYGPTRGYRPLREAITGLMQERGIETSVERLVVSTGS